MSELQYHYIESGLDNVFLQNGYAIENHPDYGELISLSAISPLHRRLDEALLVRAPYLTGAMMRVIRVSAMELAPDEFAKALGLSPSRVTELEVARDERLPDDVEAALRTYASEKLGFTGSDARGDHLQSKDPFYILMTHQDGHWVADITSVDPLHPSPATGL